MAASFVLLALLGWAFYAQFKPGGRPQIIVDNGKQLKQASPMASPDTRDVAAAESATTETDRQPRSSRVNQYVGSLDEPALPARSLGAADTIFRVWVVIYGLVGAQMGWILRPFIGSPNEAFAFLRPRDGNFFLSIGQSIRGVFGW